LIQAKQSEKQLYAKPTKKVGNFGLSSPKEAKRKAREEEEAARKAMAPDWESGRYPIEGTILNLKDVESDPFFVAEVEGKMVAWVRAFGPKKLLHFKEQNRLRNVMATAEKLSSQNPAFRNAEALKYHD
jgi:hypothetical protein